MPVTHIRRRNGELVSFDVAKIAGAIFEAAKSVGGHDMAESQRLAQIVADYVNANYSDAQPPKIEEVQDLVEQALIKTDHVTTAKAFILYRAERRHQRTLQREELLQKMAANEIEVTHDDGTREAFDSAKIEKQVRVAAEGLKKVDIAAVVEDACGNLYNGVKIPEIEKAVINAARTRIERHPEYSLLASRLLMYGMYKTVFQTSVYHNIGELPGLYREGFARYIAYGVEAELLNPQMAEYFDMPTLAGALHAERDLLFHYLGAQTIFDRYLLKTRERPQKIFELPQWLWMRVAMGLALQEKQEDATARAIEFYNTLSQFYVVSSTPTLFNSGTTHAQMSSCYLNTVDDSLTGIFKTYQDNAQLSKWAGGIGTDWTSVRGTNAFIKGTNGASQGVIPFLKIFNDTALAVNQGGKRKGACCAYLEVWHSDIEEFLEAKKNTGDERRRLHDVNTANWIPDLFMKRVEAGGEWTLFSPNEAPELHDLYGKAFEAKYLEYEANPPASAKKVDATKLWRKMLTMLYETGHPWVTFKDPCNIRSPQDHVGVVHNSNLCTEITLNTSKDETAVCNLASLNLANMIDGDTLNKELIETSVKTAMRMLDNVIDGNYYPTVEAQNSNMRHRPVGLGMMGYQDALYELGINFASDDALAFADESMEMVAYYAILGSSELAKERGTYESYKGSKWDRGLFPQDTVDLLAEERGQEIDVPRGGKLDWAEVRAHVAEHGMRNSNTMAIAPTATISNIAGTTPCIEPTYKNIYMKENLSGSFVLINRYLVDDLEKEGMWNEGVLNKIKLNNGSVQEIPEIPPVLQERYRETFEIEPSFVIRAASRRAKWIDQSASTNIFLKTTSGKLLHDTYMLAWKTGLKTTYYLRTLGESQVQKTVEEKKPEPKLEKPKPAVAPAAEVKFCKLDDPDCEACQ